EVFKQMLPVLANLVMGGLFKQATGQAAQAGGFGATGNPIGDIIEQMMRQGGSMMGGGQPQRTPRAQPQTPFDNPFGKVLQDMFGGGAPAPEPQRPSNPMGDNPLGRTFEEMMR